MSFKNLLLNKEDGVATIIINRPDVRNALNRETWLELREAIKDVGMDDNGVKVAVITGAGDKAFVGGADIKGLSERSMFETLEWEAIDILSELENLKKPVIAAVNGFALGGGCELAMACDIRIASENAKFGQPEVGLGIIPGAGGTQRLPRLVGKGKAKELIFTGDIIDAREAERIGLVNKVVPQEELMNAVKGMTKKIMGKGHLAVRLAKEAINAGMEMDLEKALLLERIAQTVIFSSEDRAEGLSAFLEKRKPAFKGE